MDKAINLAGRVALAYLLLWMGIDDLSRYNSTPLPTPGLLGVLLPLVILVEIGGGMVLLLGWKMRSTAVSLALFAAAAAIYLERDLVWLLAGGLLALAAHGVCSFCLGHKCREPLIHS